MKTFLLTGAAGGLGRHLVEAALRAGHNVLATDLTVDGLPEPHDRLRVRAVDVTSTAAARAAVRYAVSEFGGLDVLVNSAGYRSAGSIEDMPEEEFRRNVEINFFGAVNMVRAALPVMRPRRRGSIVNVSTIGGRRAQAGLGAYQAAKWALGGFTEILAREVAPIGVHATLVEPGGIRTPWAAAPLPMPPLHDEYEPTVGAFVRTYSDNPDVQRGDPAKMASVILRITDEPEPPVRLLLGSDAAWLAPLIAEARAAEDAAWREVSVSTDLDGLGDFSQTPVARMVRPPQKPFDERSSDR
ncbi:SDR family NAD(P)-dependent oxidoreductase [Nonomuraea terrae]|uniref:SDR family NAD(P)-dependent oxidoreductase n=1 Tax=Nonomuraea terrae TaxID=2530383 RepID=A0A4R4ZET1_9ACTN|nr:SDR family NAD(P)-dependent oxidoreductase [Nonomuraea terrae]TDD57023.1 SDR family NAD(P)-dependent oxidoreductase [Nonomuraea terrae]